MSDLPMVEVPPAAALSSGLNYGPAAGAAGGADRNTAAAAMDGKRKVRGGGAGLARASVTKALSGIKRAGSVLGGGGGGGSSTRRPSLQAAPLVLPPSNHGAGGAGNNVPQQQQVASWQNPTVGAGAHHPVSAMLCEQMPMQMTGPAYPDNPAAMTPTPPPSMQVVAAGYPNLAPSPPDHNNGRPGEGGHDHERGGGASCPSPACDSGAPTGQGGKQSRGASSGRQAISVKHDYHDYSTIPDEVALADFVERKNMGGVVIPFPEKLHELLTSGANRDVLDWSPHGRCFIIKQPKTFAATVMPRHFKHAKFTSFQRQLNLYGFKRITRGKDRGAYYHELFLRSRPKLSMLMRRVKVKGNGMKPTPDPENEPDFYGMTAIEDDPAPPTPTAQITSSSNDEEEDTLKKKTSLSTVTKMEVVNVVSKGQQQIKVGSKMSRDMKDGGAGAVVVANPRQGDNKARSPVEIKFLVEPTAPTSTAPEEDSMHKSCIPQNVTMPTALDATAARLHQHHQHQQQQQPENNNSRTLTELMELQRLDLQARFHEHQAHQRQQHHPYQHQHQQHHNMMVPPGPAPSMMTGGHYPDPAVMSSQWIINPVAHFTPHHAGGPTPPPPTARQDVDMSSNNVDRTDAAAPVTATSAGPVATNMDIDDLPPPSYEEAIAINLRKEQSREMLGELPMSSEMSEDEDPSCSPSVHSGSDQKSVRSAKSHGSKSNRSYGSNTTGSRSKILADGDLRRMKNHHHNTPWLRRSGSSNGSDSWVDEAQKQALEANIDFDSIFEHI